MYIVLGIVIILLLIVTVIYYKEKTKITKELEKIEKENGINKKDDKGRKKRG